MCLRPTGQDALSRKGTVVLTANAIGVDEADGNEVVLRIERAPVRDGKRLVRDGIANWTPHVDDTNTTFQKTICVGTEMAVHASDAGIESLVDVDTFLRVKRVSKDQMRPTADRTHHRTAK